jgi:hypothetical protein
VSESNTSFKEERSAHNFFPTSHTIAKKTKKTRHRDIKQTSQEQKASATGVLGIFKNERRARSCFLSLSLSFSRSGTARARADKYTHGERREMAPPRVLGGSGARRERGRGEEEREEDARGAVRNLVRDIKTELAMQREREHVPGGKGNEGADDGDDARAKKMLEELVERHFRRGVYVGTFSSLLFSSSLLLHARDNKQQTLVFFKNTHALKNLLSLSLVLLVLLFLLQAKRPRRR